MITWLAVKAAGGAVWRFLRSIPWWAWLVAAALLAAFLYGEVRFRAGEASRQPDVDAADHRAAVAVASNATLVDTVRKLQQANADWASKNAADVAAGKLAVAAVERERDALQTEIRKRRADRNRLYDHDQAAAAWGRTAVPSAVVRSLQDL
ncbi:hypothetical protein [Luteibacter sp.]|uniref:hypothetical protein n=1 Tax=Luteibacter sp. TaxID=1886636 RepID=UPI0028099068|nr:hypothetical protein [Luteibacter sp.]MDQ8050707.1 hypothetical protein [Luteibacter sp.]